MKLTWLEILHKGPQGPVLIGLFGASAVTLAIHQYWSSIVPDTMFWLPWSVGPFALFLLTARAVESAYRRCKDRPCAFRNLTPEQQQFLIQQIGTGDRFIRNSDGISSLHWYKELRDEGYIGDYSHMTRRGWKKVEAHIAKRGSSASQSRKRSNRFFSRIPWFRKKS